MTTENASSAGGADDLDLFEAEATGQPVQKETAATIPEKYKGKTVDDLINMHQNAEKLVSRQGSELGQMRRMADEILQLKKPTTQVTEERKPVTVDALLNDPEQAIANAVANSPIGQRALRAEERANQLETRITESEFLAKHKNVAADVGDPAFLEWVNKNSLRQALAARASGNGDDTKRDFVAAKNLWDLWDEHKELVGTAQTTTTTTTEKQPKKVASSGIKASPAGQGRAKPIWSRAKLMDLRYKVADGDPAAVARWNDPAFRERMHEAYAEERVK